MSAFPSRILSTDEIKSLEQQAVDQAEAGSHEAAWHTAQALRNAQHHQEEAAQSLIRLMCGEHLPADDAADLVSEVAASHPRDVGIMAALGDCLEAIRDIDDLNAPPPQHPAFAAVIAGLEALAAEHPGGDDAEYILRGLSTSARISARQGDEAAERCYRRLVELNPEKCSDHYNLGLLFKTRGRFEEGVAANQTAARLAGEEIECYEWNLGICATGAGNAEVALDVWKRMGQNIEIGRFGLPEGPYPQCKVKLAERPLAERTAETDDPGLEETIWIERLSPCHGIIRSVLYQELGVDYGDVILIDGAPITYHTYGDREIPVFPHLATLVRNNYQLFDFAGTQEEAGQLADASVDLPGDALVYSHTESYRELCSSCWRDPNVDHEHRESLEKHVVTGRIAAPAGFEAAELLDLLDTALNRRSPCQLYAPDLCAAAGLDQRASVEGRRFELLTGNAAS